MATVNREAVEVTFRASYDPEDDKLRLRASDRFDDATKARVKAHKFSWAPKQKLWVAYWSPAREDLCIELAGHVGEEDTSLEERTLQRYDRFTGYLVARTDEAEQAVDRAEELAQHGTAAAKHRVAERKARRLESANRQAVNLWDKSEYWQWRSRGVVDSRRYRDKPDVRARRIKKIKADLRRVGKIFEEPQGYEEHAGKRLGWYGVNYGWMTDEKVARERARLDRYRRHYENRLMYEQAMLDAQDGDAAAKWNFEVGGQVLVPSRWGDASEWRTILTVNKGADREVVSVSLAADHHGRTAVVGIEQVTGYRPATSEMVEKARAVKKLPPLCNYLGTTVEVPKMYHPNESQTLQFVSRTKAEWAKIGKDYRGTDVTFDRTHRVRVAMVRLEGERFTTRCAVFITDQKVVQPPHGPAARVELDHEVVPAPDRQPDMVDEDQAPVIAKKAAIKTRVDRLSVAVEPIVADQLHETTSPQVLDRIRDLLPDLEGKRCLEPSCGTGRLIDLLLEGKPRLVVAMEQDRLVHAAAIKRLRHVGNTVSWFLGDFLHTRAEDFGTYDVVLMNPPFARGADIKHILHARTLLSPSGQIVAICAAGPRQERELQSIADHWELLPDGSFESSGTNVRTALVVIGAE